MKKTVKTVALFLGPVSEYRLNANGCLWENIY